MKDPAVIVVGAGPAGLAAAACLNQHSIPTVILEREDLYAPLWTKYSYDRLHLHLVKEVCQLPLMPFPPYFPKYVSRPQFLQYLENYVTRFKINPLYRRSVEFASFDGSEKKWKVRAKNLGKNGDVEEYKATFLVVATGETADAWIPEVEGLNSFKGHVFHSTKFKSGEVFRDKRVLVVGAGNSGMEIALDLAEHGAKTSIVVRSPTHVLSREMMAAVYLLKFLPFKVLEWIIVMLSKLVYGDMSKYGIKRPAEGPFAMKAKYGKYPVLDVGTCKKIRSGEIQVLPAIASIKGDDVIFENGQRHPFDTIIFATGFRRSTNKWLKEEWEDRLLNEDGFANKSSPSQWKGNNGLYCVGLSRRGLHGICVDALNVANDIKALL